MWCTTAAGHSGKVLRAGSGAAAESTHTSYKLIRSHCMQPWQQGALQHRCGSLIARATIDDLEIQELVHKLDEMVSRAELVVSGGGISGVQLNPEAGAAVAFGACQL